MAIATETREKKKRGLASLLNLFSEPNPGNQLMSLAVITEPQTRTLIEKLNSMIEAGVLFVVSINDFQVHGTEVLPVAKRDFLTVNKTFVLCALQQSLLMKYLPKDLIPDYIFEVRERAAIQTSDDTNQSEIPFEIVRDITREWFADLLDEMV